MKTAYVSFVSLLLILFVLPTLAQDAVDETEPGFFVLNQYKIPFAKLPAMQAYQDSIFTPVFDELIDEEKLMHWGLLTHAWGDEWNYNWFFITEDHRSFLDFWDEFFERVDERFPGWQEDVFPLIDEHKDNMYNISIMR